MCHQYRWPSNIMCEKTLQLCTCVFLGSWRSTINKHWSNAVLAFPCRNEITGTCNWTTAGFFYQPALINEFQSLKFNLELSWVCGAQDIFQLR